MNTRAFFDQLDHDRMVAAIAKAEQHTSGEIRVYVSHRKVQDAQRAATRQFLRLGMTRTRHRNAVLIFVAPQSQGFAIIGDEAVHARCGQVFWEKLVAEMTALFQGGRYTDAIVHGIDSAGRQLAGHFPADQQPRNELPDAVAGE